MKLLLLSAYHAHSHAQWARGLAEHLEDVEIDIHALPPRHFAWRFRGNALAFAHELNVEPAGYHALLATSMVDLATLRGIDPRFASLPTALYFHENQFAYPSTQGEQTLHFQLTSLYSALAADRLLFNSAFNRDSFLEGASTLLKRLPDHAPSALVDALRQRSHLLPVPLHDTLFEPTEPEYRPDDRPDHQRPLRLLWNHRWEYDKAPQTFFNALFALHEQEIPFRLVVLGERFRQSPDIFDQARERLGDRIDHFGFAPSRAEYLSWLRRSDVVISTARQEFQGLAVMEAVALGCRPLLPERLAYPNFFGAEYLYPSHATPNAQVDALVNALRPLLSDPARVRSLPLPDLHNLRWTRLRCTYYEHLNSLCAPR
ncbi:DUF3524 domain-containing protein [Lujinxingia litoralis]|uniref:tRNA-queuosine alpha-mannosyltransferase n=1 Tax=Lujinxingia litoralis TaxID=2211119 RepID=A0A328C6D5_9DELT|nr:DUF3524 domain-containing protein [Lujinxingia litoralis]RAL23079.1 DUF3524 domain-containing protein [Lujinxingia litoralis]